MRMILELASLLTVERITATLGSHIGFAAFLTKAMGILRLTFAQGKTEDGPQNHVEGTALYQCIFENSG
jgi:hypothetical protein